MPSVLGLGRVRRRKDGDPLHNDVAAVHRVDVPRRRVEKRQVGDEDPVAVHQLHKVPARVLELVLVELGPPHRALTVDRPVVSCSGQSVSVCYYFLQSSETLRPRLVARCKIFEKTSFYI